MFAINENNKRSNYIKYQMWEEETLLQIPTSVAINENNRKPNYRKYLI